MTGSLPDGASPKSPGTGVELLDLLAATAVDPGYAGAAGRSAGPPPRHRWWLAVVALLVGALVALSMVRTGRDAPVAAQERRDLLGRVRAAENGNDELRRRVAALSAETSELRRGALGVDEGSRGLTARLAALEPAVGVVAVTGPGMMVEVDDGPGQEEVLDTDLQILVNGLWSAGAEAVAVNGHRLSSRTAIRGAGAAITVNYRSLTAPYRIEAVGDPRALPARFVESAGGAWWNDLAQNRGMTFETRSVSTMTLAADPGLTLRHARPGER